MHCKDAARPQPGKKSSKNKPNKQNQPRTKKGSKTAKSYKDKASEQGGSKNLSLNIDATTSNSTGGPTGTGKTTLLNLSSGLESSEDGSINVKGTEPYKAGPEAKRKQRKAP
jgi:ABC-type antimicrobial peptide transport system, ATPase component